MVAVVLLQNSRGALPEIMGGRAMLALPFVVALAMHEREVSAAVFGALTGLLLDVSSVLDGFNTIVLMAVAVVCSLFISRIMQNNIVTALVLNIGATALYYVLYIGVNLLVTDTPVTSRILVGFYLPSYIYTVVFVPLFYFVVRKIFVSHKTADE
jgi:rod shape-determining protein MreD